MPAPAPTFEWADWTFAPDEWRLTSAEAGVVSLHNKSLELLALLLERAPALVSKDDILAAVWRDAAVEEGNIAFHIAMLRKALDRPGAESCIQTVRARGYRFVAPVTRRPAAGERPAASERPAAPDPPTTFERSAVSDRPHAPRRSAAPLAAAVLLLAAASVMGWAAMSGVESRTTPGLRGGAGMTEAESLVLQARQNWRLRTAHSVQQAIAQYERAIVLDPSLARAHAGLADCYNITMSGLPTSVRYERAKASVDRALALDPNLAEALTAQAFMLYKFERRWDEADASFRRAMAADPSYALARHWYGEYLGLMGRYDEAVARLQEALALEPGSLAIQGDLVPPLLRSGRVAEARAIVERAAGANPNWFWIPRRRAEVLAAEGRERESLEELWRSMALNGASLESVEELRAAYRDGGMAAVLRLENARLEAAEAAAPNAGQPATFLSLNYARLGDTETAMRWIRVAVDRREDAVIHLLTNPSYDRLRSLPAFQQQLAALGLTPLPN